VHDLRHVCEAGGVGGELDQARAQRVAAGGVVEFRGEGVDGGAVEVEAAIRVAARGEDEERASSSAAKLVLVDLDLPAGDGRDGDDRDRKLRVDERRLELRNPRLRHPSTLSRLPGKIIFVVYASPWRRLTAWLIEFVVVILLLLAGLVVGSVLANGSLFFGFVVALSAVWLYFAGFESSPQQSTLSGRLLGTKVTDVNGEPLTFTRATSRHFAMYLSALTPIAIGYLMVFWTKRRQTLHDYLARTIVVRTVANGD
jgi:uncharacterized RDD family membrane protein YckC